MTRARPARTAGRIAAATVGVLLLSAYGTSAVAAPGDGCGLTVDVPAGFTSRRERDGIVLRAIGWESRRSPAEVRLMFQRGAPSIALPETRRVGSTVARYRLTTEAGGSGGEETTLVAEMPVTGGFVRLEAWVQRDDGAESDLGPAWRALSTARCTELTLR